MSTSPLPQRPAAASTDAIDRWVPTWRVSQGRRIRMLCLAHAGGAAASFRLWPSRLPAQVAVCPVELPGRGTRPFETPYRRVPDIAGDLVEALSRHLTGPYVVLGHSMGAALGFELYRQLRRRGLPRPLHLFAVGARAPHRPPRRTIHELPEDRFLQQVKKLGGTPQGVLEDEEMRELLLPCLRADFEAAECYRCDAGDAIEIPITGYGAFEDEVVSLGDLIAWRRHTLRRFSARLLPGDHFFPATNADAFLRMLGEELAGMA